MKFQDALLTYWYMHSNKFYLYNNAMNVKENNTISCGMTIAIYYYYHLGLYIFPTISQPAYIVIYPHKVSKKASYYMLYITTCEQWMVTYTLKINEYEE